MTVGAWHAQPFPPQGASAAEGIRNQLGRPELDLLTILVREAAQNSWDARIGDRPVDFRIELKDVGPAHAPAWREMLQRSVPAQEHLPLRDLLKAPTIRILTVSDRGTTGLGGPTRADSAVVRGHDFVSFVRNVGEPRDTEMGGGTYGFGKGIFYLLSSAGTVLIHTRCRTETGVETRLIGCALWKSFVMGAGLEGTRYTGRHWWGVLTDDVVEPLTGVEAERVAHQLGLQPFESDETGTTVVVVDPVLGEDTAEQAADYLAESIAWNLWPKMLTGHDKPVPDMRFSVQCNGSELSVPDPRETRPLDLFVAAYEASWSDTDSETLWCKSPTRKLGVLGLEKRFMPPAEPTRAGSAAGIEGTVHHVCLMRAAELVVTYHECAKPPAEHVSYAGVFRADEEMDSLYAQSEPPTHDAWRWHSLEGRDRTFVRTTFRRLKETTELLIEVSHTTKSASAEVPLGAASRVFSSLVAGAWGAGGATAFVPPTRTSTTPQTTFVAPSRAADEDVPTSHSGDLFDPNSRTAEPAVDGFATVDAGAQGTGVQRGRGPRRARVEFVGDPYFDMRSNQLMLIQEFRVVSAGLHLVTPDLAVSLPGVGRETDPPRNAAAPRFFAWEDEQGILHRDPFTAIDGTRTWKAVVKPAPDTVTEIGLTAMVAEVVR